MGSGFDFIPIPSRSMLTTSCLGVFILGGSSHLVGYNIVAIPGSRGIDPTHPTKKTRENLFPVLNFAPPLPPGTSRNWVYQNSEDRHQAWVMSHC